MAKQSVWHKKNKRWHKQWRQRNAAKVKVYQKRNALRMAFKMELEEYNQLLTQQGGVCAICRQPETRKGKFYLAVDHCHSTGVVRGLLCGRCNLVVGQMMDNPVLLRAAATYLEKTHGS
jgi:hypothetical protein